MTEQKPGWIYIDCIPLQQRIALHEETGWVFCEDKTHYAPEELDLLEKLNTPITLPIHRVKRILGGNIVEIR